MANSPGTKQPGRGDYQPYGNFLLPNEQKNQDVQKTGVKFMAMSPKRENRLGLQAKKKRAPSTGYLLMKRRGSAVSIIAHEHSVTKAMRLSSHVKKRDSKRAGEATMMVVTTPFIIKNIFRYLTPQDLNAAASVCQLWNKLAWENDVWIEFIPREWKEKRIKPEPTRNWRWMYYEVLPVMRSSFASVDEVFELTHAIRIENPVQADYLFSVGLSCFPNDIQLLQKAARFMVSERRLYERAEMLLRHALKLKPKNAVNLALLGTFLSKYLPDATYSQRTEGKSLLSTAFHHEITVGNIAATIFSRWAKETVASHEIRDAIFMYKCQLALNNEGPDRYEKCLLMSNIGFAYMLLPDIDLALDILKEALHLARELGDRRIEGDVLSNLSKVYFALKMWPEALETAKGATDHIAAFGSREEESFAHVSYGNCLVGMLNYTEAIRVFHSQVISARQWKNEKCEIAALGELGYLYFQQLDTALSLKAYKEESALIDKQVYDTRRIKAKNRRGQGHVYKFLGKYRSAQLNFEEARDIALDLKDHYLEGLAIFSLGEVYEKMCDFDVAKEFYKKRRALCAHDSDLVGEGLSLARIGNICAKQCTLEGYECADQLEAIVKETQSDSLEAALYMVRGNAAMVENLYTEGRAYFKEAMRIFQAINDVEGKAWAMVRIAEALRCVGDSLCRSFAQQALTLAALLREKDCQGYAALCEGKVFIDGCDWDKASKLMNEAFFCAKTSGDKYLEGMVCCSIARVHTEISPLEPRRAMDYLLRALLLSRNVKCVFMELDVTLVLSEIAANQGDASRAQILVQECLRRCQEVNYKQGLANALARAGGISDLQGAIKLCEELKDKRGLCQALMSLARVHIISRDIPRATETLERAFIIANAIGDKKTFKFGKGANEAMAAFKTSVLRKAAELEDQERTKPIEFVVQPPSVMTDKDLRQYEEHEEQDKLAARFAKALTAAQVRHEENRVAFENPSMEEKYRAQMTRDSRNLLPTFGFWLRTDAAFPTTVHEHVPGEDEIFEASSKAAKFNIPS